MGAVEKRDGIVRRFFPKRSNFDTISHESIQQVEEWINSRPMKCLGFKRPSPHLLHLLVEFAGLILV